MSEATYLGIHALALIAKEGKRISVNKLASMTGTSSNHLSKVMQLFAKEDYVQSTRGPKGGFTLKREPEKINLLMIYELLEGRIDRGKCPFKHTDCPFEKCIFGGIVKQLTDEFYQFMEKRTLMDIINN